MKLQYSADVTGLSGRLEIPSQRRAIAFVLLLGLSYSFNGMDRQVFPALLPAISGEYGFSLSRGGLLTNIFAVTIAVAGLLSGWLISRHGRKRVLVWGLASYSLFTLLTPLGQTFGQLATLRAMTGFGEALHIATIFAIVGAFFAARRGVYMGVINSFFGVGSFLGPYFGSRIYEATDSWRIPFFIFGVAGLVSAIAILLLVPTVFTESRDSETVPAAAPGAGNDLRFINPNSIGCVAAFGLMGFAFFAYSSLYPTFLKTSLGYSPVEAGTAFGMYGIGALSAVVLGWVGEKLRKTGLLAALLLLSGTGAMIFLVVESLVAQAIWSFVFGALVSGYLYPSFIALSQRCVAAHRISHIMSLLVAGFYLPGVAAGALFGRLTDAYGWNVAAIIVVVAPPLVSAVIVTLLNPLKVRGARTPDGLGVSLGATGDSGFPAASGTSHRPAHD
jgi:MFS family permease